MTSKGLLMISVKIVLEYDAVFVLLGRCAQLR